MILNVSEDLREGTQDANSDMINKQTVVDTYDKFLKEKMTGVFRTPQLQTRL
jgi:hypothetical protein